MFSGTYRAFGKKVSMTNNVNYGGNPFGEGVKGASRNFNTGATPFKAPSSNPVGGVIKSTGARCCGR